MARQITWMRKERRSTILPLPGISSEKGIYTLDDMGVIQVVGEPLYDNGLYFVIDTVKDLEFTILCERDGAPGFFVAGLVELDKYEAFRIADEMKDADERANAAG